MSNRVRDLKTNFNFGRLSYRYSQALATLQTLADDPQIYHLRMDQGSPRDWHPLYCKLCDAFRSLNNSRPIRRMHVTGFRMVNIESCANGYRLLSDSYIAGLDCACVILDSLARFMLHNGRVTILLHCKGTDRQLSGLRGSLYACDQWNSSSWRISLVPVSHLGRNVLQLSVPRDSASVAINIAATVAGKSFQSAEFRFLGLRLDCDTSAQDLSERYGTTDLGVLLSGNRYRCFQKIGQLTKTTTR